MKVLVSLSGGMDSATVLARAIHHGLSVETVSFSYGSKHGKYELESAKRIAVSYKVPHCILDISQALAGLKSNLLLSGGEIPEGHYEEQSMSLTVVPGRNLIFISILAGLAWSKGCGAIWFGAHAGDHAIYEDCRPAFLDAMNAAVIAGTGHRVSLVTPFLYDDKVSILRFGLGVDVPYILTRTCYKDQEIACGKCGSCQERLAAFLANEVEDPLRYESRGIIPKT